MSLYHYVTLDVQRIYKHGTKLQICLKLIKTKINYRYCILNYLNNMPLHALHNPMFLYHNVKYSKVN